MTQIQLNGQAITVDKYTVSKKAKLYTYPLPMSALDTTVPLGVFNRTHELSIWATSDTELEQIMAILQNTTQTLTDIEGNNHTVALENITVELVGGRVGVYNLKATFVEVE
jgi:hypothetical protein